jgi:preprotein translocase subunit SecA
MAQEEIENIKKTANKEEFYNLERRIMLQSIDELWMRHIDAMSRLREDVAFE